jgi:protein-disulfide isomerase
VSVALVAAAIPFLVGAACGSKKDTSTADGVIGALDTAGPLDKTPLTGIDTSKLPAKQADIFYKLADSLKSPCGKAHSLRTSVNTDTSCKRAPFAARYVLEMLAMEATEKAAREFYDLKYIAPPPAPKTFKLDGVPHQGATDAPIQLVEFFDYGCPVCVDFKPELDRVKAEMGSDFVIYYKMWPIVGKHPDSMSAAQAALAAHKQGKFQEMHDHLFSSGEHKKAQVQVAARTMGLDLMSFDGDYAAAEPLVRADMAEGESNGVDSTPTLFFNGRPYEGPLLAKFVGMWIAEEIAVNR